MSRIGKKPLSLPTGVTVSVADGRVHVKGPKGDLSRVLPKEVTVVVSPTEVTVSVANPEEKKERALWGTFGAHITNMVEGVTKGFTKQLEISGVGYRAAMQGKDIKLEVGFSHPVIFNVPSLVTAAIEKSVITLTSIDKELLGQTAAELRAVRKPEPYKGKGIKYSTETVRRKAGKAAKAAA
jgi:large subunit ribosomal protein L6